MAGILVRSLNLSKQSLEMAAGSGKFLKVTCNPSNADAVNQNIEWEILNSDIAWLYFGSEGTHSPTDNSYSNSIEGTREGSTFLRLWYNQHRDYQDVPVKVTVIPTDIIISGPEEVTVGDIFELNSEVLPSEAYQEVGWGITSGIDLVERLNSGNLTTFKAKAVASGTLDLQAKSRDSPPSVVREWSINIKEGLKTFTLVYHPNGAQGDPIEDQQTAESATYLFTVQGQLFNRSSWIFKGWTTSSDGSGAVYTEGDLFEVGTTPGHLYAKWEKYIPAKLVESLTLDKQSLVIPAGGQEHLTARCNPPDAAAINQNIEWEMLNSNVAWLYFGSEGTHNPTENSYSNTIVGYQAGETYVRLYYNQRNNYQDVKVTVTVKPTDIEVILPGEVLVGDTFEISAKVLPPETQQDVGWGVTGGANLIDRLDSSNPLVFRAKAKAAGTLYIQVRSRDKDFSVVKDLEVVIKGNIQTIKFIEGPERVTQGDTSVFVVRPEPVDAVDKRIEFSIISGGDGNTIESQSTSETAEFSQCTIKSSDTVRANFTVRAKSIANPLVSEDRMVKVDKVPTIHGAPNAPLREHVIDDLENILGDTYYIQEGYSVNFAYTADATLLVAATGIAPAGSGLTVDGQGNVAGRTATPGTYLLDVEYEDETFSALHYNITIVIVKDASVPATGVTITGPQEVMQGERIEIGAKVVPDGATYPAVTFVAMNNRVKILDPIYDSVTKVTTCTVEGVLQGEVIVRATSGDGAASSDYKVNVLPGVPGGDTWVMDAGMGAFPNGMSIIQGPVGEEGYYLPDWSVVNRPGFRLNGWKDSAGNASAMGALKFSGVRWTAVWIEDKRTYDLAVHPHAAVRLYRSLTQYIDLTEMCIRGGEPVVSMAENRPGQATFTAVNIYDEPTKHLIADTCALWSSGDPGAVTTGMYCTVEDIQSDGTVLPLFDGFVTTITPDAEAGSISFVIGDRKSFLGKAGTSLRRNYYVGRTAGTVISAMFADGKLYGDLSSIPSDAQIEPPYKWRVREALSESTSADNRISVKNPEKTGGAFFKVTMPAFDFDTLGEVHIKANCNHGGNVEYISNGQLIVTTAKGRVPIAYRMLFNNQSHDFSIDFDLSTAESPGISVGGPVTLELTTDLKDMRGYVNFYTKDDVGASITYCNVAGDVVTESKRIVLDVVGYDWHACDATREGSRIKVDRIEGVVDLTDETLYKPPQGRMSVSYLSEDMSTVQTMSGVALAVGHYPLPNNEALGAEATALKVFRTGGGYAQDYLQKLADVPSSRGRMRAFRALGFETPAVVIGARHDVMDTPAFILAYGGETISSSTPIIRFAGFSPQLTMKNRPSMIMVRGTGTTFDGQSLPLMVAVENFDSKTRRRGLSVEQVLTDSSINNPLGAARAGYAQVNANDLDRWEGTITLPDIQRDLLELDGPYAGSGVAVRIYDYRNGLKDYPARVKEARFDYNTCTTTATLVNYSMVYSSAIGDTVATADAAADVATGSSNNSLYSTQYVRVVAKVPQTVNRSTMMNRVRIYYGPNNAEQFTEQDEIQFLDYPGNRTTLVTTFPPDGTGHTDGTRPYDVHAVQINEGDRINIPVPLRPDYYEGQTLIVNIDFPTR